MSKSSRRPRSTRRSSRSVDLGAVDHGEFVNPAGVPADDVLDEEIDAPIPTAKAKTGATGTPEVVDEPTGVSDHQFRSTSDPDLAPPETETRRRRSKKRRTTAELVPEWEAATGTTTSTAEGAEDRAVDGRSSEGRGEKRSRVVVKKRRPRTRMESFFLKSPKIFTGILAILLVTIAIVGTYGLARTATDQGEVARDKAEISAKVNPSVDPEIAALIPEFLTSENEAGAAEALRQYLHADGWEAKLAFVRQPDEVRGRMMEWYGHPSHRGSDGPADLGEIRHRNQVVSAGRTFILLAAEVLPSHEVQYFAVEKAADDRFLVDWEVSEGYQPMPLEDFQRLKPTSDTSFRVRVKRHDYYNYGFSNPDEYVCYRLYYPGRDFELFGYVAVGSDVELAMDDVLEGGDAVNLIVRVRYPELPRDERQVIITDIDHPNWYR